MKRLILFFVLPCLLILGFVNRKALYVNATMLFIPKKDKEHLEYFFHALNMEGYPWVAKGIKPIASHYILGQLEALHMDCRSDLLSRKMELIWSLHPSVARFHKGLKTWKKYSWLFPKRKVVILNGFPSILPSRETVLMINLKSVQAVVEENHKDFREVLGKSFAPDALVRKIIQSPGDYEKILKGNHFLMGILYGYGTENAKAFHQREGLYFFSLPPFFIKYNPLRSSLHLGPFLESKEPFDSHMPWFHPPGFMVNPLSSETKKLEQTYLSLYKEICAEKSKTSELKWSLLQLF